MYTPKHIAAAGQWLAAWGIQGCGRNTAVVLLYVDAAAEVSAINRVGWL